MAKIVWLRGLAACTVMLAGLALAACPGGEAVTEAGHTPECGDEFRTTISRLQLNHSRAVDLLFVIDNTRSMAEEQVKLNEAAGALFERLDAVNANYRVAFTTTDNGNPWCPPGTYTPEAGNLVLSSCQTRLEDFTYDNGAIDVRDFACNDQCSLDAAALAITPTSTDLDSSEAPRPWIERAEGVTNLPAGTDPVEAFKCFAPQGVNGCGFESPLESMYLALARTRDSNEASYGFARVSSVLAVVVLTDEADCSYDKSWAEIFEADGNKAFWSDPLASFPSSAVCWNAGVSCTGDPSLYDSCEPVDKAVDGAEATSEADAVLHPLGRYLGLLEGLEQDKQELNPERELVFTLIAGVEGGGEDWSVSYADAEDPEVQLAYGIGPGCVSANGDLAVPPVRARALAEAVDPRGLYSVCRADFSAAMAALGERITEQFQPLCVAQCVADADRSTPQLEPDCVLEQDPPGNDNPERVLECARAADGTYLIDPETETYQLPAEADLCYAALVDPDGSETLDPRDDMSAVCRAGGYNLEYLIVRREGVPAPDGTAISLECDDSDCPEEDCPGIGG